MTLLAEGIGRTLGESEPLLGALVLVSVFPNAGNYGIPISEFAFGPTGRATAVVYLVAQAVAMYTLGVYVAARGEDGDWREGVRSVFTIPLIYALLAALLARWVGLLPPADAAHPHRGVRRRRARRPRPDGLRLDDHPRLDAALDPATDGPDRAARGGTGGVNGLDGGCAVDTGGRPKRLDQDGWRAKAGGSRYVPPGPSVSAR